MRAVGESLIAQEPLSQLCAVAQDTAPAQLEVDLHRHAPDAHELADTLGARVVAFSSLWTVAGAPNWQASFAKNWGVYLVGSNITSTDRITGTIAKDAMIRKDVYTTTDNGDLVVSFPELSPITAILCCMVTAVMMGHRRRSAPTDR